MALDAVMQFDGNRIGIFILDDGFGQLGCDYLFIVVIHDFFHAAQQDESQKAPALPSRRGRPEPRCK